MNILNILGPRLNPSIADRFATTMQTYSLTPYRKQIGYTLDTELCVKLHARLVITHFHIGVPLERALRA